LSKNSRLAIIIDIARRWFIPLHATCEVFSEFQTVDSESQMLLPTTKSTSMKKAIFTVFCFSLSCSVVANEPAVPGVSENYSYAMGVQFGQLLKAQGITQLDSAAFSAAIDDVLGGRSLRLSEAEMKEAILEQQRLLAEQRAATAQERLKAGNDFLTANAERSDIVVLPSGIQYRVLETGSGERPGPDDKVRVHYQGTLLDGSVFDSSLKRGEPAEFPLAGVIPGFREALSNMQVGDRWEVFIPAALAYGERGAGAKIGPNETLVFDIQLLEILR
jgi:FKBP-type peptidyl-prolyl cis-trans isomerase FklB